MQFQRKSCRACGGSSTQPTYGKQKTQFKFTSGRRVTNLNTIIMKQKFENIVKHIICAEENEGPLSGINAFLQFSPEAKDDPSIARNLNAAFLILLSGESHPLHKQVSVYFNNLRNSPS